MMRDKSRVTDWSDRLKYICLGARESWYMSIGGEVRPYYERFRNEEWGAQPQDLNGFLLQRYMLHTDLNFGSTRRVFGQLKSNFEDGRRGGPRGSDEDKLDIHQAFADRKWGASSKPSFVLRFGRQELQYGSARLVSVRKGPNVRQSFDGVRFVTRVNEWQVGAFATRPVETNRGYFDDSPERRRALWGVYAVHPIEFASVQNIDLYYLGYSRTGARFEQSYGKELRHTLGARVAGSIQSGDYNSEFMYQFGAFGVGQIRAWATSLHVRYTFEDVRWQAQMIVRASLASGDKNPSDADLQTFNPMFPTGNYFGQFASVGPMNHRGLHPSLALDVTATLNWVFYWRNSNRDGVYGIPGNLLRTGQLSGARFIGHQPGIEVHWQLDRHTGFTLNYARYVTGRFLAETPPGRDTAYFAAWMTYRF